MSVCPNDRQCNGGEGKEMEPGSEKVRRSLPSHSEPSLPSHVRPSSAKSSCSLHKMDSADYDSLPPIRILISPPSLSPLSLSPFPLHLAILLPISPYLSLHSPVSGRRSALQFIRIIPSDRKPSFQPRSQSARRPKGGREGGEGARKVCQVRRLCRRCQRRRARRRRRRRGGHCGV